jgi:hypothetical protein
MAKHDEIMLLQPYSLKFSNDIKSERGVRCGLGDLNMTKTKTNKQTTFLNTNNMMISTCPSNVFFWVQNFIEMGKIKIKKNIVSQFISFFGEDHENLKLKNFHFYLPHFNYAFNLVAIFN